MKCDVAFDVHMCSSCPDFQKCLDAKLKMIKPIMKKIADVDPVDKRSKTRFMKLIYKVIEEAI